MIRRIIWCATGLVVGLCLAGALSAQTITTSKSQNASSTCFLSSAGTANPSLCKAQGGIINGLRAINTNTTIYYLRLYNLAAAPTCSSPVGYVETIPISPAGASGGAAGFIAPEPWPQGFDTGIAFCLTGGGSGTDNQNAATGIYVTLLFK